MNAHLARNKARYIVYFTAESFFESNGRAFFDNLWDTSFKQIFYKYSWTNEIWPEIWGTNVKKITVDNIIEGAKYRRETVKNNNDLFAVLDETQKDDKEIDCNGFFSEILQALVNNAATNGWCSVFQPKLTVLSAELGMVPPSINLSSAEKKKISNSTGLELTDEKLLNESLNETYKIPSVQMEVQRLI